MATAAPAVAAATSINKARKLAAPNSDFYQLVDVLTDEELALVRQVRTYMETKVQPITVADRQASGRQEGPGGQGVGRAVHEP